MNAVTFEVKDVDGMKLTRVVELRLDKDGNVQERRPATSFDIPAITIAQAEQIATAHLIAALGVKHETTSDASSTGREPAVELNEPSVDSSTSKASSSAKRKS